MNYDVSVKWNAGAQSKVEESPNRILYSVARQTLDLTYKHIPMSAGRKTSGRLRRSSMSAGVRGRRGEYYVGSYTSYAKKVWNYGSGTHWTTPDTFGKWYARVYNQYSKSITERAIRLYKPR